jgi:hypothetical protein
VPTNAFSFAICLKGEDEKNEYMSMEEDFLFLIEKISSKTRKDIILILCIRDIVAQVKHEKKLCGTCFANIKYTSFL